MLNGCFGGDVKNEIFYNVVAPKRIHLNLKGPKILVNELGAGSGYDTARIAVRMSTHEIGFYGYRSWVSEPARMISEALFAYLRASGRFALVGNRDSVEEPDAIVSGTIDAIEQLSFDSDNSWKARLAMTLIVRKPDDDKPLFTHSFDESYPCREKSPSEVARGIGELLKKHLETLSRQIVWTLQQSKSHNVDAPSNETDNTRTTDDTLSSEK